MLKESLMDRPSHRLFLWGGLALIGLGLLAGCGVLPFPSSPPRAARIGFLSGSAPSPRNSEPFQAGLRDLGYVEGRTVVIEWRFAEGQLDQLPGLAADLVGLGVDVLVAEATQPALAAKQATETIPVVFVGAGDPDQTGLVASLARPGGNVTGLSTRNPELSKKRLELLKETIPQLSRVAVLFYPANPANSLGLTQAKEAAPALGLQLQVVEVNSPDDFEGAFQAASQGRAEAILDYAAPLTTPFRARWVDLTVRSGLPAIYALRSFMDAGGLMSYGANGADLHRRAATYVDKILKGTKPRDLPVEDPMKFDLVINLKTAQALGLTIPQSVLQQATELIQ